MWLLAYMCDCVSIPFQSALGWDHQSQLSKHSSQTDAVKGFGGKFGVQKDLKDKVCTYAYMYRCDTHTHTHTHIQSALGWEYQSELSKHESQTDATKGFGGKFGVQKDRQDQVRCQPLP